MEKIHCRVHSVTACGGLTLSLLMATTALAQTVAADAGSDAKGTDKVAAPALEMIVVTADRKNTYGADLVQAGSFRGAKQLDTPLTISVITQEMISSQQAKSVLDALRNTAGVTSAQTSPTVYNNLSIRGISVENRGNYRLDGSLPIVNLIDLPLEDKDRVEALKGASALYYGFTTPSGIINLTMKRPTNTPMTEVNFFGDSHGGAGVHVDTSATEGKFGHRINLVYANVDSGIQNTAGTRALVSGAFDYKPTDKLSFTLDAEYIYKKVGEPTVYLLTAPKSTTSNLYPDVTIPSLLEAKTNLGAKWFTTAAQETNILAASHYKISDTWDLTVEAGASELTRDRHFSAFTASDYTTGAGTVSLSMQPQARYKNRNIRAQVAGTFYTGPLLHEVLFGWSENVRDQYSTTTTKYTYSQNMYTPVELGPDSDFGAITGTKTRIDDIGSYVFDRIKFQQWLQILAGVRYSDYTESNQTKGTTTYHATPTSVSYGAVIKPKAWMSLYGTYIEGLETTAATPSTAANAGVQLPATESTQKEYGLKVQPTKGLLFQIAHFDIDREVTYTNSQNIYVQDGRARYQGEELSLTGDLSRDISIYGSALFLDAKQISGAATTVSGSTVTATTVGKYIENTAKTSYSVAGKYRLSHWIPSLSVTAGMYYTGKRFVNALNEASIPGYTLFDLGASYATKIQGHHITFRVNGENITNKKYWVSTGSLYLAQGAPGTVKFSISSRF